MSFQELPVRLPTEGVVAIYWEPGQQDWIVCDGKQTYRLRQDGKVMDNLHQLPKEFDAYGIGEGTWKPKLRVTLP